MTWNAGNLARGGKELSLLHLLQANRVDVAIITEAELPEELAPVFSVTGCTSFLPLRGSLGKTRVITLVKSDMAMRARAKLRNDIMSPLVQSVWLQLDQPGKRSILLGGIYREWSLQEKEDLDIILGQVKLATESSKDVLILGDLNLDLQRLKDQKYYRRSLLHCLVEGMEAAGLTYVPTLPTYRSYGKFKDGHGQPEHRMSCLDHVYHQGLEVEVEVLNDASSDHRPVVARLKTNISASLSPVTRRNFKAISRLELEAALRLWPWEKIHNIQSVEKAHDFLVRGISEALDVIAPVKTIRVRRGSNLYLSSDTLNLMRLRDRATGREYRHLRNRVASMVKRDRLCTNLDKLRKSNNDPRVIWSLANSALGKSNASLPSSITVNGKTTAGKGEAASALNSFYIEKVRHLRNNLCSISPTPSCWPKATSPFCFSFASAGKIAKVITSLKNTDALGLDGIPTSVLKKGVEVLASPLAHLVNRSLATGVVPEGFKTGVIIPIHKGKGKSPSDPASYRPVSILPAMSKVLETVVKQDLELHLTKLDALPNSQFGFRKGRSCTGALATAHAKWIRGNQDGKVVGILAFDLSAAFDTVDKAQLLPKLEALGINGTALDWFASYLTDGKQCVDWDGTRSPFRGVEYGVRQGSILGPILYLVLVADMPDCVGIGEEDNSGFADDTSIWAIGDSLKEVEDKLNIRAGAFTRFATSNSLVLNASKTQLLVGGNIKRGDLLNLSVIVDGTEIKPANELELLGVKFDHKFTTKPHENSVAKSAKQRAALVARLAHHLPRGEYLRQLAKGLLIGKINYAAAAVVPPRLAGGTPTDGYKDVQVAINNAARSITGIKKTEHVKTVDLLHQAGLPSLNYIATRSVAMESWLAFHSSDGGKGERNLLGKFVFPPASHFDMDSNRTSRSKTAGMIPNPLLEVNTFAVHAVRIWNASAELRTATTRRAATKVAKSLAMSVPI